MNNENDENDLEAIPSFFTKIKTSIFNEENNNKNNYIQNISNKTRNSKNIININKSLDELSNSNINSENNKNKKNNIILYRTLDNKMNYDIYEEIIILSKKYISKSCDKVKRPRNIFEDNIPFKKNISRKNSACNLTQKINTSNKKNKNNKKVHFSHKKIKSFEMKENIEIKATTHIRKISSTSEKIIMDENDTNIDSVLNLNIENNIQNLIYQIELNKIKNANVSKYIKNNQLDSIEEVYEEEYDQKTKSKNNNNCRIKEINLKCDNVNSQKNLSPYFSNEQKQLNNNTDNSPGLSTKYSTGKYTNNIFDIPSEEENNTNYMENNEIDCENEYQYKTITDIEHDSVNNLSIPIKPNENDNSISFMNTSDINKLFNSPSKKGFNNIDYNNYVNNNIKYNNINNNSAINKRNKSFEDLIIKFPRINNIFKHNNNSVLINRNNNICNNNTYVKKRVKRPSKFKPQNSKNIINLKKLNMSKTNTNKIKEIKLSLNKNKHKQIILFFDDIQKIKKIDKELFKFDNNTLESINLLKEKIYTKIFKVLLTNVKPILIDSFTNCEEIENIRKNGNKDKISIINKTNNYTIDNDNNNVSTVIMTLDKYTQSSDNNIIRTDHKEINQFNMIETNNLNSHSRNRGRNMIEHNNSLPYKNTSLVNLSSGFNSYEIKQGGSNVKKNTKETKEKKIEFNILNNIQINNDDNQNKNNINFLNFINKINGENKLYISIESYEEFIKDIIIQTQNILDELLIDNNHGLISNIPYNKNNLELDNLLLELEKNIKFLKYNYLSILVQKHYSKTREEKINVINNYNIPNKREIFYIFYQNMLNIFKEKIKLEDINYKKNYIDKIIQILNNYKTISKIEIKDAKNIYKEENKISPEILESKWDANYNGKNVKGQNNILKILENNNIINKKIVITTSVMIPLLYGINYLIDFYNNYK